MKVRRDTRVVFVGAGIWNNVFFGYFGQYTRGREWRSCSIREIGNGVFLHIGKKDV